MSVLVDVPLVNSILGSLSFDQLDKQRPVEIDVVGMSEVPKGHSRKLALGITEHSLEGGITAHGMAVRPNQGDCKGGSRKIDRKAASLRSSVPS